MPGLFGHLILGYALKLAFCISRFLFGNYHAGFVWASHLGYASKFVFCISRFLFGNYHAGFVWASHLGHALKIIFRTSGLVSVFAFLSSSLPSFSPFFAFSPQAPEPGQGAKAASRRLHPFFSYKLPNRDGMTIWVCFRVRRVTEAERGRKRPLVSRLTGVVFVCGMVRVLTECAKGPPAEYKRGLFSGWQSGFYQQEERGDSPADSPSINIFRQNRKNMPFSVKNKLWF